MAIVKMKRLHMMALESDRDRLFDALQQFGCLEVAEQSDKLADPEWTALVHRDESALDSRKEQLGLVSGALATLDQYVPAKSGLLSPLPQVEQAALYDDGALNRALDAASQIQTCSQDLTGTCDQIQRENGTLKTLEPWLSLDVPLNTRSAGALYTAFGMIPASLDLEAVRKDLALHADTSELYEASTGTEMHYLFFLCHRDQSEEALDVLKSYGFSNTSFKGITGTARETYDLHAGQIQVLEQKKQSLEETLRSFGTHRPALQLAFDRITQDIQKESCKERLLSTDQSFFLDGWVTAPDAGRLEELLGGFDCAYELTDPTEEEIPDVPVKLKNNFLTRCMNVVTEMYSLPAYDGLDPNPLMAPFFIVFFGMMMADMGYGILMIAAALVVLKKTRPREGTRNFMELVLWCGISTLVWGAMTGGFLGDFIPQIAKIINPDTTLTSLPHLFTPLDDTVAILLGSLVLGVIQVVTGMAVSVVKKTRDGQFWDAFWDEITWWVILAGIALAVLGVGSVAGFPVVLIVGCVMLLYGATRNAKGFGKVTALIGTVYNGVTGYFSDILSYLRLMALMLSGSVIAQVFNTLGSVFGNVVVFIIISLIGNALNLALNLLGCYVHDLRLQCLEYFGRFYKEGGKPYQPLSIQTKYNDIIKEEQ
ncbi:MAG: V-type ATP synthase subunit I [Oscillospiraceae bacterium]|nr:V-type ATP synthase subunit I [Oscillospiraceae bacterium]